MPVSPWFQHTAARRRLPISSRWDIKLCGFNTQPPEGGWDKGIPRFHRSPVSTHSRPKAAGRFRLFGLCTDCFNTQPPEGGCTGNFWADCVGQFQHTAARRRLTEQGIRQYADNVSTHSRPKAAASIRRGCWVISMFQHTAARRRLPVAILLYPTGSFQHTAARRRLAKIKEYERQQSSFNTQPPEGG